MSIYLDVFLVSDRHVTGEISVYGASRDGDFPGGNIGDGHRKRTRVASGEDDDNALLNSVESGDSKWIVEIFIGGSTEGSRYDVDSIGDSSFKGSENISVQAL